MTVLQRLATIVNTPVHSRGETYYMLENLAILLSSGTDILSALEIIKQSVESGWMKGRIDLMTKSIDNGQPLWRALAAADLLPTRMITLIKIGEEAGRLPENLSLLVIQSQKERMFRARLQSAMLYPALVLTITVTVGIGIAWFVLPRLTRLFSELHIPLPIMTRVLMWFGTALEQHGFIIMTLLACILGGFLYIFFVNQKTKVAGQWLVFHIPGIKRLAQEVEISRFGYLFGTLLTAGLPLVDALRSLTDATPFRRYSTLYHHLALTIEDGKTIADGFASIPGSAQLIPLPIQQMFTAAWNSGRMPETALNVGKIFEEKVEVTTKNISTLLEPILLVIVWLGVVNVALAVILPIYQLIGNLNGQTTSAPAQTAAKPKPVVMPVKKSSATEPTTPAPARKMATVAISSQLKVRSAPKNTAPIITRVAPKTSYPIIDETPGWYKIVLSNNTTGWVGSAYVTVSTQ